METSDRSELELAGPLEAYRSASLEASDLQDVDGIVGRGLDVVLAVTRSAVAFVGLVEEADGVRVVSRVADESGRLSTDAMTQLAHAVVMNGGGPGSERVGFNGSAPAAATLPMFMGAQLRSAGQVVGMIGVANGPPYTASQWQALALFADRLASTIEISRLRSGRRDLIETLVNVRAELDLSERRRVVTEERARSAERLERAHELALDTLRATSSNLRAGENLAEFYRLLTRSIASLVGAKRVLFWQLNPDQTLTPIRGAHGIDDDFADRFRPTPCDPDGTDLTSQVVYKDLIFRAALTDRKQSQYDRYVLDTLQVTNAISVPWRAGDERLGVVAAYDSDLHEGFTREDAWVLQIAGLAAGLVWQLKHAETQLGQTIERLVKVDAARQLLLKNLSTAVDRASKRFATELHDDALQKLTAAELGLARAVQPQPGRPSRRQRDQQQTVADVQALLQEVEEALRKLLFDVRPPTLESPDGLEETIRDRLGLLKKLTGIDVELEFNAPNDLPSEIRSLIYRQVAEALTNIEKHAAASKVRLSLKSENDGVYAAVIDNGRGFIVSEREHLPGHLGLLALNERALLAGGWCRISAEPGAGTIVEFWVPIPR